MRHTSSVLTVFFTTDEKLIFSKPNRKVNVWAQTQTMTNYKLNNSIIIIDVRFETNADNSYFDLIISGKTVQCQPTNQID